MSKAIRLSSHMLQRLKTMGGAAQVHRVQPAPVLADEALPKLVPANDFITEAELAAKLRERDEMWGDQFEQMRRRPVSVFEAAPRPPSPVAVDIVPTYGPDGRIVSIAVTSSDGAAGALH